VSLPLAKEAALTYWQIQTHLLLTFRFQMLSQETTKKQTLVFLQLDAQWSELLVQKIPYIL